MKFYLSRILISSFAIVFVSGCFLLSVKVSLAQQNNSETQSVQLNEKRSAAKQLTTEAEQMLAKGTADARRAAIEKFQTALTLFRAVGDKTQEAAILNDIGAVYDGLGERQKALEFYNQALPLRREAGDKQGEAVTLNNIGVVYRSFGEPRKALENYNQSLALIRSINDKDSEAAMLNNLGAVYRALGELQKALDVYAEALPLWLALKNVRGEAVTLSNLGGVYRSLGNQEKALEFYNQSLVRAREAKDRRVEGETLNNIGAVHRSLGSNQKAVEFFNQALEIRRAVGDRRGEAATLNNLGGVTFSLGDYQKALEFYEQSLKLWRTIGDRSGEAGTLHNMADVFLTTGDKEKALKILNDALVLRRAVEDKNNEAATLYKIARIERELNRLADAQRDMEQMLVIVEDLRSRIVSQDLRASYFSTVQLYYESYVSLLMSLHKQDPTKGYNVAALQASERARARSLLDLLQEANAELKQGSDPKLLAREKELLEIINAKAAQQAQAFGNPQRAELAKSLGEEINKLSNEYDALQTQIKQRNPRYAELTKTLLPTLPDIQKLLDKQTLLIEYKLADEKSFLWLVSQDKFESYELSSRSEIETLAKQFYESLTERNRKVENETTAQRRLRLETAEQQLQKLSEHLSQTLLSPIATQIGNKRLVIIADGALQFIPFASLTRTVGSQQSAVNPQSAISMLPSIAVLSQLRRDGGKKPISTKSVAVFADPVFEYDDPRIRQSSQVQENSSVKNLLRDFDFGQTSKGLPRLFASREEANAIVSFAPKNTSFNALDFNANREQATSDKLGQYRVVHFATHGLLNTTRPELSGIVLSLYDEKGNERDGFLRLNQIYNLKLSSDLVVLSACSTALGKEVKGEGLIGLTRGFMYAGSSKVIASLWKVDDEATAELMKLFYRNLLQKKMSASNALSTAQIEMQQQTRWRSPYYWSAFVLQGDWR
jgi:CHAT domain-containing protein